MNTVSAPRLDRLSALMQGLAPRVCIAQPQQGTQALVVNASAEPMLHLHLVVSGCVMLHAPPLPVLAVAGPAIVVCRADIAHALRASSPSTSMEGLIHARACLDGPVAALLLAEFAQPLVVPLNVSDSSLDLVVQLMAAEVHQPRCGQSALMDRAGDILFIGLMRHLIARPTGRTGLLTGLSDLRIAAALVAMHSTPHGNWNLDALAGAAGMSRTSFAMRFHKVMNQPPGKYLARLRLLMAQRAVQSGHGLKHAARLSGYASASALSRALSRANATPAQ